MNRLIIKILLVALSFFNVNLNEAQQKLTKVSQSINVTKDVTINLNSSYSNIVFDTWNKDVVEIEAYIEGEKLSNEELEKALKAWNIDIDATKNTVTISTKGTNSTTWAYRFNNDDDEAVHAVLKELKFELADLPEMNFRIPELPELPKLPEAVSKLNFDYKAYQKEGKKYLDEYTKKFESSYGKDYAKKMEAWGEKFEKEWGEKYGKEMEAWSEHFAKQMEQQAKTRSEQQKELAKQREQLAEARKKHHEEREKLAEERRVLIEKMVNNTAANVKKVIKIKIPKGAKLKVNIRHGEIEFAGNVTNLNANLAYAKLTAQSVNGSSTSINASYSPVYVTNWNLGQLNLSYVNNATLNNVKNVTLASNSSNITINNLLNNAVLSGNITDLKILKIDDAFSNLNVTVQNSNATIILPKVQYHLQFTGNKTRFSHPKKSTNTSTTTFATGHLVNGKNIVVNAKYGTVNFK